MDVNTLIAQAAEAAEHLEDQTKVQEGGNFEYEAPPAGLTPARFIGYVELGKRKQRAYQGKDKPPAEEVRLYFELNGSKHRREVEVEGEKKTFTNIITVKLTKKLNDKAGFTKLFKKMLYGRDSVKHMAQMLGEGFLIKIIHNTVAAKDGKPAKTYANMKDDEGNWLIQSPNLMQYNEMGEETGSKPVPVPEPTHAIKLLLWSSPSTEQWASIFIDGTRTVKGEDGSEREVSKNWLQEDIVQNALNFEGSALQTMLGGLGDLTLDAPDSPAEAPSEPEATAPAETTGKPASAAPAASTAASGDILADLGL